MRTQNWRSPLKLLAERALGNLGAPIVCLSVCACQPQQAPNTPSEAAVGDKAVTAAASSESPKAALAQGVNFGKPIRMPLIDDLEDNDGQVSLSDMRDGYWFTYADEVGSTVVPVSGKDFTAAAGGAEESAVSANMKGTTAGSGNVYVGVGFNFVAKPGAFYDASSCTGIEFWGKKTGDATGLVRFKIGDAQTSDSAGVCTNCYNDFGADIGFIEEWRHFDFEFKALTQHSGWGDQFESLMVSRVTHVHWQVKHPNNDFDISVDGVSFTGCSAEADAVPAASPAEAQH